jgi:molybdopterin converting factor subunit 1
VNVQVKLFAVAKQLAGTDTASVELPGEPTVADLRAALARDFPVLEATLASVVFAVNAEYATDQTRLATTDKIACIPPVSGG